MLAKTNRLTRTAFTQYFKTGRRHQSRYATLIVAKAETFHGAVVVNKKVSKKAVTRNAYRRRIYAQLYQLKKQSVVGVYIVIVKPAYKELTRQQQQSEIATLIEQVV